MEFVELIITPRLDGVVFHGPFHKPIEGTLCITGHHTILSSRQEGVEELLMLHENIDLIERKLAQTKGSLVIKCKDFRIIQLDINNLDDFNNVATSIERLVSLDKVVYKYPFFFRAMYTILEDGWTAFRPEVEFSNLVHGDEWRLTYINSDFSVCPTYPKVLLVPKSIDDDVLKVAAKFRQGGRFPTLSYRHGSGAVLLRSGQPLVGPNNKRCREDEKLLNSVIGGKRAYVIDTRSQNQAHAAKARGGGYEMETYYLHWKRLNHSLEKGPSLLDSLAKLMDACNDTSLSMDKWLSKLDSSNWMTYVKDTLYCCCSVAQSLEMDGASVLVHGSEGTDATLIVTSITQIILNPDCRTVRGLEALIEREWLQAGYPFSSRHSRSCYSASSMRTKAEAPVFLLFLDCISQLQYQFPCSFEFSPSFLIMLFEHSYASQFGTFLCNNEKERENVQLSSNTASLWSYINRPTILETILNPVYEPNSSVIWPSVAPMSLNFWSSMYLRWVIDQTYEKEMWDAIAEIKEEEKNLRLTAGRLRRQLEELEKDITTSVEVETPTPPGPSASSS